MNRNEETGREHHTRVTSRDINPHTPHSSVHQHGRRLEMKLVLYYGANVCIHVYITNHVRSHTLYHLSRWTVLQITGRVESWGGVQGLGRLGWRKNSDEQKEFCVVASQTFKLYIHIHIQSIYMYPPPLLYLFFFFAAILFTIRFK